MQWVAGPIRAFIVGDVVGLFGSRPQINIRDQRRGTHITNMACCLVRSLIFIYVLSNRRFNS